MGTGREFTRKVEFFLNPASPESFEEGVCQLVHRVLSLSWPLPCRA